VRTSTELHNVWTKSICSTCIWICIISCDCRSEDSMVVFLDLGRRSSWLLVYNRPFYILLHIIRVYHDHYVVFCFCFFRETKTLGIIILYVDFSVKLNKILWFLDGLSDLLLAAVMLSSLRQSQLTTCIQIATLKKSIHFRPYTVNYVRFLGSIETRSGRQSISWV